MSTATKPTILLVHGAWHGSWCWKYQIPELEKLGYETETLDLPCVSGVAGTTQFDDVDHVRSCVEKLVAAGKRVVVLAHSYGGLIGSGAITGMAPPTKDTEGGVVGLIVLCGFIYPSGMDCDALIKSLGGLPYVNWDTPSEGLFQGKNPADMLYKPDVTDDLVQWALPQLRPQSTATNTGVIPPQAWQEGGFKGRLGYIEATEDCDIPIAAQKAMLEGAGGIKAWHVRTLEGSGHSPQISRPRDVAVTVESLLQDFETTLS